VYFPRLSTPHGQNSVCKISAAFHFLQNTAQHAGISGPSQAELLCVVIVGDVCPGSIPPYFLHCSFSPGLLHGIPIVLSRECNQFIELYILSGALQITDLILLVIVELYILSETLQITDLILLVIIELYILSETFQITDLILLVIIELYILSETLQITDFILLVIIELFILSKTLQITDLILLVIIYL